MEDTKTTPVTGHESHADSLKSNRIKKAVWDAEQLDQLKNNLYQILNDDNEDPSLFTQATLLWSNLFLWEKIAQGFMLVVPAFFIGILVQATILVTLSVVTLALFTLSAYLMDNHTQRTNRKDTRLRQKVFGLADVLVSEIELLQSLHKDLSQEIDDLHTENETLSEQNVRLGEEISRLKETLDQLKQTQSILKQVTLELETTNSSLKLSIDAQTQLLHMTQEQLELALTENKHQIVLLDEQIKSISGVNQSLSKELKSAKHVALLLNEFMTSLSVGLVTNREQFEEFLKNMETIIANKLQGLDQIAEGLNMSQQKIEQTATQIDKHNDRYQECLERHLQSIECLEQFELFQRQKALAHAPSISNAKALGALGIYAQNTSELNQGVYSPHLGILDNLNLS